MASHNRQERQLMRQRGAGSRNVNTADFGLNFDLGASRQDRQLMRQRGAGTHKADAVDFRLSFRTPDRRQHSNSKTPLSRTSNGTKSTRSSARRATEPLQPQSDIQSSGPTKRRKLTEENLEAGLDPEAHTRRRSGRAGFTIAEQQEQGLRIEHPALSALAEPAHSPLFVPQDDKENREPKVAKKALNPRKRKSTGLSFRRSGGSATHTEMKTAEGVVPVVASPDVPHSDFALPQLQETPATIPPKKRKKRKSVILVRKRRRSSGQNVNDDRIEGNSKAIRASTNPQDKSNPHPVQSRGYARPRLPTTAASPGLQRIEPEDDADEDYVDEEHSPEPPTPAPPKKGRKSRRGVGTGSDITRGTQEKQEGRSKARKSTFPILTHRMSNFGALPTIQEEAGSNEGADGDEEVNPYAVDRTAPNAVDVLAQICRESIAKVAEHMEGNNASSSGRTELRRKRAALEAFGKNLDDRLFEMSAAVENRITLESRVRKINREKADLQARWMEVRQQREQIALRCDHVRRQHWEEERDAEDRWRISEAAQQTELQLERNEADEEEGLEYLLRTVAGSVSNLSAAGGVLERIKAFNAQLERMAGILEKGDM